MKANPNAYIEQDKEEITNYTNVDAKTLTELEEQVLEVINAGWQPFGNIITYRWDNEIYFVQTLVRYNK